MSTEALPPHSNDVEEELRRIRLALDTVYASQTAPPPSTQQQQQAAVTEDWSNRQMADRYLTSFQKTAVAWIVCDQLLQEPEDPSSAVSQQRRFFAAQTLHKKCGMDFHELPAESITSLRDSLFQYFQSSTNVAVTNRLAMALAALSIQMGWYTVITDFLGAAAPRPLMLFFLRALPEECASDRLNLIQESNRYTMRDQLIADSVRVFQFLQQTMIDNPNDRERAWQVLHHWIRYVPVRPEVIADTPLLNLAVQKLAQAEVETLEAATDVVVEILRMYPSHHSPNEQLVRTMIPLLSHLPLEQALSSDDEDIQRAYCRVVTEMGESYLTWLLSPDFEQASQLVTWILQCAGQISDVEISSITLHFWYRFVTDMEIIEPDRWRQELIDAYEGHLLNLISVCAQNLMKYPEETPMGDQLDDWERHRFYVSETIEDCCRLLGGTVVIQRMNELFQAAVQSSVSTPGAPHLNWQAIEACLACLCAMHRFIPNDENSILPAVFELLPQLPTDNIPPLRATVSRTIGKYAAWLSRQPRYLAPLLPFLAQGLNVPECAKSVSVAIKELCFYSNPGTDFDIAEPVLQLYQEVCQSGKLTVEDELQILEGVCHALSRKVQHAIQTNSHADGFLERLVNPIGQRMSSNLHNPAISARQAVMEINRLAVLVQHLKLPMRADGSHPIVTILQSIWSPLVETSKRYASDGHMAEHICRLYKYSLRSCDRDVFLPLLHPLMHQLMESYQFSHQSPYLYAASICLTEYGSDSRQSQPLYEMAVNLAETTFSFMKSLDSFRNHPDIMEEFFYMMERMIVHCPDPLIRSPLLPSLLQCSALSLELDHPGVNKGTLKFLQSTFSHIFAIFSNNQGPDDLRAGLEQILQTNAQPNVVNLVRALSGDLPCYSPSVPDILWYASRLGPVQTWISAYWSNNSSGAIAMPSERVRSDLLATFNSNLSHDEFRLALRSYEDVCLRERRFRRTV
jgi:transportin-3